ncbi:hypothetical protein PLESTB_001066400 [Pleodorina starrii]|uniref:Uncharacterized protein n=1 Tax=Pleodorina starrii TaxID=330485 RepID=A0A9W6BPX1_9CHLO|nr:hypothetical protein PLESTM_001284200 [Pleodorina starrii]GLC56119.1 hypothetical protein PLESTB_001066400 [Pleodorina starrii]GLC64105.1 hypothetical protein PLESTF_000118600 [Pleodorina starrii]
MAESAQDVRRMALGVIQSRLMDSRQLMDEFRSVLGRDSTIRHSQTAAHAAVNQTKNRYSNVLPYDHNRVLLRACDCGATNGPTCTSLAPSPSSSSSDYINASHVVHSDAQCGFTVSYIASQGPLPGTETDFWRMCWAERVGAVVMLTNTVERGINKCSEYYPAQLGVRQRLRDGGGGGGISVAVAAACGSRIAAAATEEAAPPSTCLQEVAAVSSSSLHGGDLTYTVLRLVCGGGAACAANGTGGGGAFREVAHLHYTAWPDHGTPADAAAIRTLCDLVEPLRAAGGAVVVHCSAGIGRTGTFCAIDILRRRLAHLEVCAASRPGSVRPDAVQAALDLPELVHSLRRQRSGMVQTIEQYAFCYQAVYEELQTALGGRGGGGGARGDGRGATGTPPRMARR